MIFVTLKGTGADTVLVLEQDDAKLEFSNLADFKKFTNSLKLDVIPMQLSSSLNWPVEEHDAPNRIIELANHITGNSIPLR
jgi:hypothetical protein